MSRLVHIALSVDVDRFSDAYMRKHYCRGITHEGGQLTPKKLRKLCVEARSRGLQVFPACDNTDERGFCQGHEEDPVM